MTIVAKTGIELFREIQNGTVKITIENGYISFVRISENFPLDFKIRIPDEQEITLFLQNHLQPLSDHLPDG